ncbi:hypothetical protein FRB90_011237 [Tulasnella sp. 427]|nr:hypothetical protein FRB90_011237 [Tulasnella sp. 427]
MSSAAPNLIHGPILEVPQPPEEFCQDGGKFYRCYDALAEELDEDMVKGLKEQLDGMLIFAGLFAGVNSAFLALTLPLLSADPADDTNALLAQNNAILLQFLSGRNDTIPAQTALPSAGFSPARDILTINALFSLSLAFAIISSFLAVIGRQWLVYYRKRGGGGTNRQRWEQLKRFLGAERWHLEPVLDDVLPSILQMGLIIFCASLILYLRHLNPSISIIVGVPMYVGLAIFIGTALPLSHAFLRVPSLIVRIKTFGQSKTPTTTHTASFTTSTSDLNPETARTRFSRLSHLFRWIPSLIARLRDVALYIPIMATQSKSLLTGLLRKLRDQVKALPQKLHDLVKLLLHALRHGREQETVNALQVIALQRTICISDEPLTLMNAFANIRAINDYDSLAQLCSVELVQQRMQQIVSDPLWGLEQFRGHSINLRETELDIGRLVCCTFAHVRICLSTGSASSLCDELQPLLEPRAAGILLPESRLVNASTAFIKATVMCHSICFAEAEESTGLFVWFSAPRPPNRDGYHLAKYATVLASHPDPSLFVLFSLQFFQDGTTHISW